MGMTTCGFKCDRCGAEQTVDAGNKPSADLPAGWSRLSAQQPYTPGSSNVMPVGLLCGACTNGLSDWMSSAGQGGAFKPQGGTP